MAAVKYFGSGIFYEHKKMRKVPHLIFVVSHVLSDLPTVDTISGSPCIEFKFYNVEVIKEKTSS